MASLVLTDAQLMGDMSDELKKSLSGMPNYLTNIVAQAHGRAVSQIVAALAARGYTYAQIQSADQTPDLERSQTLYWALRRAGVPEGWNDTNLKALDVREDLKEIALTQGGAFVIPGGTVGVPNVGLSAAPDDIFQYPATDGTPPFPPGQFAADDGDGIHW